MLPLQPPRIGIRRVEALGVGDPPEKVPGHYWTVAPQMHHLMYARCSRPAPPRARRPGAIQNYCAPCSCATSIQDKKATPSTASPSTTWYFTTTMCRKRYTSTPP